MVNILLFTIVNLEGSVRSRDTNDVIPTDRDLIEAGLN